MFREALLEGVENAKKADYSNKEIDFVFSELEEQLRIKCHPNKVEVLSGGVSPFKHIRVSDSGPIMSWSKSEFGYPVHLICADIDTYRNSKQELESAICEALRHPATGAKLRRLVAP